MNITFLIGNGFDLRLGMDTRFTDMYEGYIVQDSASDAIRTFKDILKADAPNYKTWGDFEMAMAQKAKEFKDEESFIECLRDFKLYMVSHIENEQTQFNQRISAHRDFKGYCVDEAVSSIEKFYIGLRPNVINEFLRLGVRDNPKYSFISFNYTTVFDSLLGFFKQEPIHIHGKLGSDIVLGADNFDQVKDIPYKTSRRFNRAFIKPEFNKSYDNARLENAGSIIDSSDIICIYGMSLGESDLSWTKRLKDWLLSHKNNHLIYFVYDESKFNKSNWDAIIDEEEDRIATLLERICDSSEEMDKIFNQIHIPVGYDIFNIDELLKAKTQKMEEEDRIKEELRRRMAESKAHLSGV